MENENLLLLRNYNTFLKKSKEKNRKHKSYVLNFLRFINKQYEFNKNIHHLYMVDMQILNNNTDIVKIYLEQAKKRYGKKYWFLNVPTALKQFYAWLFQERIITEKTNKLIQKINKESFEKNTVETVFSIKEINYVIKRATLLNYCKSPFKFKTLLYLLYYTGLRKKELLNLKRHNFDLENNRLFITFQNNIRTLFYPEKIKEYLIQYFEKEPEEKNAFNITPAYWKNFTNTLKKYRINEKTISIENLRYNFADLIFKKTGDLRMVQTLLDINDLNTIKKICTRYPKNLEKIERTYKKKIKHFTEEEEKNDASCS